MMEHRREMRHRRPDWSWAATRSARTAARVCSRRCAVSQARVSRWCWSCRHCGIRPVFAQWPHIRLRDRTPTSASAQPAQPVHRRLFGDEFRARTGSVPAW